MQFVAIDVETANPDFASICQIGLARFKDGQLVDTWEALIDPDDYFDGIK
jgi:DNA polymerase-3 subunit epsilon